nr:MAG TPA: hypothetical protein [Caudoviricetes sp.]
MFLDKFNTCDNAQISDPLKSPDFIRLYKVSLKIPAFSATDVTVIPESSMHFFKAIVSVTLSPPC